ncbi:hypothetical protein RF11_05649 [Thelohanellus kitauei]|uniref:Uncharacterized protein n=1 Tax=Thelohanellus kitauei TaxID=669202 RepID=A0A0C2ML41_THEKT|nr:hypothetical protein RF11_05649 [Thelohanellus kitauei]
MVSPDLFKMECPFLGKLQFKLLNDCTCQFIIFTMCVIGKWASAISQSLTLLRIPMLLPGFICSIYQGSVDTDWLAIPSLFFSQKFGFVPVYHQIHQSLTYPFHRNTRLRIL